MWRKTTESSRRFKELDLSVRRQSPTDDRMTWPEMAGGILVYKDHLKREGSCGVRIFESDDNSLFFLIVLTELKNNNGPHVANAVEAIVNLLCCRIMAHIHQRDADCTFVFVERSPNYADEFDWIELKYDSGKWHSPNWRRANEQETTFLLNLLKT